jgi:putative ABC transport system ATP-binding protein
MLRTKGLKYVYYDKELRFPDLTLKPGEKVVIRGKSGSGKTTLLHILGGLLKPMAGEVEVDTVTLSEIPNDELEKWRKQNVGLVLQQPIFPKYLTFKEHLSLLLKHKGIKENCIAELAEELGVTQKLNSLPGTLSGGERQRMALLNALIHKPTVLLIDEATANLDDENASALLQLIFNHMPQEGYVLMASHDARVRAMFNLQIALV